MTSSHAQITFAKPFVSAPKYFSTYKYSWGAWSWLEVSIGVLSETGIGVALFNNSEIYQNESGLLKYFAIGFWK